MELRIQFNMPFSYIFSYQKAHSAKGDFAFNINVMFTITDDFFVVNFL